MSKSGRTNRKKGSTRTLEQKPASDRAIYLGLLIIGGAVILAAFLISGGHWREVTLGYLMAMAWLINLYAFIAYRGRHLANWKQALAKIPLRPVGFGTKHGKPLAAAHDAEPARRAIIVSVVVCIAALIGFAFLLLPELRS